MKFRYSTLFMAAALIFTLTSCNDKDECVEPMGINGVWTWEQSVGGFAGSTLTPESEGKTQTLVFDDFIVEHHINDTLFSSEQYDLEIMDEPVWGFYSRIVYESGRVQIIDIGDKELTLIDQCADCYNHTYNRRR